MNHEMCGTVRELIPDFVGNRLADADLATVERHVVDCRDCAAELELAQMIFAGRPRVPEGLVERLTASVRTARTHQVEPSRGWWGVAAAVVAALALGIGLSSHPSPGAPADVPGYAYEVDEGEIWVSDDGLLAGAPLFDDLSDDALLQLLDELSVASAGGAA
ncbi:MAG: zf-HC2 domain-containing protein [Gemmatimonadota bacterium]|jgi:anti-sigma factor RsiW